jgi:hypothetical protein
VAETRSAARPTNALHRGAAVSGWSFVAMGTGHLALSVPALMRPSPAESRVFDAMRGLRIPIPGPRPTLADSYVGFSVTMAVLCLAVGALLLIAARRAGTDPSLVRAVLKVAVLTASAAFAGSLAWFPLPPIVLTAVAAIAAATGLLVRPGAADQARPQV